MNTSRNIDETLSEVFGDVPFTTLTSLARRSGINIKLLRKQLKEDNVPFVVIGKRRFYARNEIRVWMCQKRGNYEQ